MKTYINREVIVKIYIFLSIFYLYGCSNNPVTNVNPEIISQNNKRLFEMFVNTRCTVCPPADRFADSINSLSGVTMNDSNLIIIRYHTTLYSGDPFYDFNPIDNFARQSLYEAATANPKAFVMSKFLGVYSSSAWIDSLNNNLSSGLNSVGIKLINNFNPDSLSGSLTVKLKSFAENLPSDLKTLIIITENNIFYNAPNGINNFNNVMRDIIPDASGINMKLNTGNISETIVNYDIDPQINFNNSFINVFIQDLNTKQIYGVERIKLN